MLEREKMNRLLPGRFDLIVFVLMALACGLIVQLSPSRDYMLGVLAMPIFLIAALRGLSRSRSVAPIESEIESSESVAE